MSHATRISGRCQSSVKKKCPCFILLCFLSSLFRGIAAFSQYVTQNVQNSSSEFDGQYKTFLLPMSAFLLPDKSSELSKIEQFDNYNLFVTTQFGKEGSPRIVCHSLGKRPQVQQSTFFLLPRGCKDLTSAHHHLQRREFKPILGLHVFISISTRRGCKDLTSSHHHPQRQ